MVRFILTFVLSFSLFLNAQNFWEKTSFTSGSQLNSVYSILGLNDNSILAGTYAMGIYKSTDDGLTWSSLALDNQWIIDLEKDNQNNIYALTISSTYGSGLFKSTDNGISWFQVWNYSGGLNDLYIDINNNIYIGLNFTEGRGGVYKSSDGGQTWSNIFPLQANVYAIIKSTNGSLLLAGYDAGLARIYRSTNEGASWETYSFPINFMATDFAISPQGTIFLSTAGYGIYRSTDNGLTWNAIGQMTGPGISCLFINGNNIYVGTRGYWVYLSTNSENSFNLINSGMGQDKYVLSLGASKRGYLFAGMDYQGVYRSVNKVITSVNENYKIDKFELKQNYPNPFNPKTNVEFHLPMKSKVKLKIYNLMGEELEKIIDEERERGVHKLNINMQNYCSGVYLLYINAKGIDGKTYTMTRKMMLIK